METREFRLAVFFQRLSAAPPASSIEEARHLVDSTLNAVEDQYSGVVADPATLGRDGRMYPAQDDSAYPLAERLDVTCYRHRGHITYIASNGAIRIETRKGQTLFDKPGRDGNRVFNDHDQVKPPES